MVLKYSKASTNLFKKIFFFGYFNNNGASFPTFLKSTNSPNLAVA